MLGQTADKQAIRDFVFAKEGASFDNPEFTGGARRRSTTGSRRATSTRTSTAPTTTRRGRSSPRARAAYLIAGTWVTADLAEQMGDKVGFMLMPGKDPNAPGLARRRGPAVRDHLGVQEPGRRGGLHRLPHRRQRGQGAGRDGQPAGDEGRAGAGRRRCRVDVAGGLAEAQRGRRRDPVPGLHDADVLRRHQRRDPGAAGRQAGPGGVHRGRAGGRTTSGRSPADASRPSPRLARRAGDVARPASRGSSATCTCCRRSRSSSAFVLLPLAHAAWHLAVRLGRADGRHLGGPGELQATSSRDPELRCAFAHALDPADLLRGAAAADRAAAGRA